VKNTTTGYTWNDHEEEEEEFIPDLCTDACQGSDTSHYATVK
jgi:hypothetical protein